jgi:hypothetical protein
MAIVIDEELFQDIDVLSTGGRLGCTRRLPVTSNNAHFHNRTKHTLIHPNTGTDPFTHDGSDRIQRDSTRPNTGTGPFTHDGPDRIQRDTPHRNARTNLIAHIGGNRQAKHR